MPLRLQFDQELNNECTTLSGVPDKGMAKTTSYTSIDASPRIHIVVVLAIPEPDAPSLCTKQQSRVAKAALHVLGVVFPEQQGLAH